MTCAGIVIYNAELNRLKENFDAVCVQVDKVICIDNASENICEVEELIGHYNNVSIIKFKENMGVARALNEVASQAKRLGANWVLTLDQDSIVRNGLVSCYEQWTNSDVGMLSCIIKDRNVELSTIMEGEMEEIDTCITSASYLNITAWEVCGGFDEIMFIDYVDFDMCLTLKKNGYKIVKVNYLGVLHEVGNSFEVRIFGKKEIVYNHAAFRKYYIVRNRIYYVKKHSEYINLRKEYCKIIKYILIVLFYEEERFCKIKYILKGFRDVKRMR